MLGELIATVLRVAERFARRALPALVLAEQGPSPSREGMSARERARGVLVRVGRVGRSRQSGARRMLDPVASGAELGRKGRQEPAAADMPRAGGEPFRAADVHASAVGERTARLAASVQQVTECARAASVPSEPPGSDVEEPGEPASGSASVGRLASRRPGTPLTGGIAGMVLRADAMSRMAERRRGFAALAAIPLTGAAFGRSEGRTGESQGGRGGRAFGGSESGTTVHIERIDVNVEQVADIAEVEGFHRMLGDALRRERIRLGG